MKPIYLRLWFAFAAAVIAAAFADPCMEALSNAGLFGIGRFTDGSNLDVIPALAIGLACVVLCYALRVRRELLRRSGEALRGASWRLVLAAFSLQLIVLFTMETLEQTVVAGHPLGGTIWLGGPVVFALALHAATCVIVLYALSALLHAASRRTVQVIRLIRALVERAIHGDAPIRIRPAARSIVARMAPVLCRTGNRAPPQAIV